MSINKQLLTLVLVFFTSIASFAAAGDNVIYFKDVTGAPGEIVELPVFLKNPDFNVKSLQFNVELPEGVSFVDDEGSYLYRKSGLGDKWSVTANTVKGQPTNTALVAIYYDKDATTTIAKGDQELITISLKIADNAAEGDKNIAIKATTIVEENVTEHTDADYSANSKLTVAQRVYDEGYAVTVAPLNMTAGQNYDGNIASGDNKVVVFKMQNASKLSKVEFDVELPEGISVGQYRTGSGTMKDPYVLHDDLYFAGKYESEKEFPEVEDNADGSKHFIAENNFSVASQGEDFLMFAVTADKDMTEDVYPIYIKNIVATLEDGKTKLSNITPSTSYVKVGSPTIVSLSLEGYVSEELSEALASETSITTVDMSKVTSIDGTLTLVDGKNYIAPTKPVEVKEVVYSRNMSRTWGTICLPYKVESNSTIQLYELNNVGNSTMTFKPVESIEAGTPAVFKKRSGNVAQLSSSNVEVKAGDNSWEADIESGTKWTMKGTMTAIELNPKNQENDIYYIAENKFWYADVSFAVAAYRAWFEVPKNSENSAKVISISEDDEMETGINYVENEDGSVNVVFDLSGRKLSNPRTGINIINGKKIFVK